MKRSSQLTVESALIAAMVLVIALGGSVTVSSRPAAWANLENPQQIAHVSDLGALARFYNTTLTRVGTGLYSNASMLISTFHFANIPESVNKTALAANADIARVNSTAPAATALFAKAEDAIAGRQLINATTLTDAGCNQTALASSSFADFTGPQTSKLETLAVPIHDYALGSGLVSAQIQGLVAECANLRSQLLSGFKTNLTIESPQTSIETGGRVTIEGNLTLAQRGLPSQVVHFFLNGSYFGSLTTSGNGGFVGNLTIPFVYAPHGAVQAVTLANSTAGVGSGRSNVLLFAILFNGTSLSIGDPPAYLPTSNFTVHGTLSSTGGVPLPGAPVKVTFIHSSRLTLTDGRGSFSATFEVPANATDGTYYVYASFAPHGVFGPSSNFTSIRIVHEPMYVSLEVPKVSFAGFAAVVRGVARSNGTGVPGAIVTLTTPWGSYSASTNQTGAFAVVVGVSPLEFSSHGYLTAVAAPYQPYISTGRTMGAMGIFNPLIVLLPAIAIGAFAFEAEQLGVFSRRQETEERTESGVPKAEPLPGSQETLPEAITLSKRAMVLAALKFGIEFKRSETFREAIGRFGGIGERSESAAFARILLVAEDRAYARAFDESRVAAAREDLEVLESAWG